jgi:hypothetical protein
VGHYRDFIFSVQSVALFDLFFAWLFQWMRFYPGNPIQNAVGLCGFAYRRFHLFGPGLATG